MNHTSIIMETSNAFLYEVLFCQRYYAGCIVQMKGTSLPNAERLEGRCLFVILITTVIGETTDENI